MGRGEFYEPAGVVKECVLWQFVFKGQVIMALRWEKPPSSHHPLPSCLGWNAMVLYADSGARDGVVATAGTRDQISWRWRRGWEEMALYVKQNGKLQYARNREPAIPTPCVRARKWQLPSRDRNRIVFVSERDRAGKGSQIVSSISRLVGWLRLCVCDTW